MIRPFPTARSLAMLTLSAAMFALAACSGDAPASDAVAPADAIPPNEPSLAQGDLSALAVGDVVLVDRTQMADEPCHAMGNVVMGGCATQDEVDAAVATLGIDAPVIIDRNQMADQPCHVMGGVVMGNCSAAEAQAMVDQVRADR